MLGIRVRPTRRGQVQAVSLWRNLLGAEEEDNGLQSPGLRCPAVLKGFSNRRAPSQAGFSPSLERGG